MMKVAGVMQKSTQIMGAMNNLIRLPQLNQVMMTMAREMEKVRHDLLLFDILTHFIGRSY
jgi:hypothetical protein